MNVERVLLTSQKGAGVPAVMMADAKPSGGVVIVHGYGGCKEEQLGLAWRVAEAGLGVCAIDLRGHGEHVMPLSHGVLADVEAAVEYCRRFGRVASVGHSLGGRLALLSGADFAIGISPALGTVYSDQTKTIIRDIRSYRVKEDYPDIVFDILLSLPVWRPERNNSALLIYGARDTPEIAAACKELGQQGVLVKEIKESLHSDVFLHESTFSSVIQQLAKWFE